MTNYLWVIEIKKGKEYVPYIARKTQKASNLVLENCERTVKGKFRVKKYERVKR